MRGDIVETREVSVDALRVVSGIITHFTTDMTRIVVDDNCNVLLTISIHEAPIEYIKFIIKDGGNITLIYSYLDGSVKWLKDIDIVSAFDEIDRVFNKHYHKELDEE